MNHQTLKPFLTFNGNAEEAMRFYEATLPGAKIEKLTRYGSDHPMAGGDDANRMLLGVLSVGGQEICFLDMDAAHEAPAFTWAQSLWLSCADEATFDAVFTTLSDGGVVMMGPEPALHFRKCAWVTDRFGVTWQPVWA